MSISAQKGYSGAERRRSPRYPTTVKLHYQHLKHLKSNKPTHLQESVTKDLSAGGLAMLSAHKLEPGQTLMLTIFLPVKPAKGRSGRDQEPVQAYMLCRVVWHVRLSRNLYVHGIQFVDLATEDRKRLGHFLKACQIPSDD